MMSSLTDAYLFFEDNLVILKMMIPDIVKGLPLILEDGQTNFANFLKFFSGRSYDFWLYGVGSTAITTLFGLLVIYSLATTILG